MIEQGKPFGGFEEPSENWSKLPHQLIDALEHIQTVAELKAILYILRHTWGYGEQHKAITLDEFEHGRKRRDGTRIDAGIGMSAPSIIDGLKRAEAHGFIEVAVDDSDKARIKKYYSIKSAPKIPHEDLAPDGGKGFSPRGKKSLAPEVKNFYPEPKETLPRSEKETLEKNFRKKEVLLSGETDVSKKKNERSARDVLDPPPPDACLPQPDPAKLATLDRELEALGFVDKPQPPEIRAAIDAKARADAEKRMRLAAEKAEAKRWEADHQAMEAAVLEIFKIGGPVGKLYTGMLRGKGRRGEWKEFALSHARLWASDLYAWAAWWQAEFPDAYLPKEPNKVSGSICAWLELGRPAPPFTQGSPRPQPPVSANLPPIDLFSPEMQEAMALAALRAKEGG